MYVLLLSMPDAETSGDTKYVYIQARGTMDQLADLGRELITSVGGSPRSHFVPYKGVAASN